MDRYPTVEVRCTECSHYRFVRGVSSFYRACSLEHDEVHNLSFRDSPAFCRDFQFRKNAARDAIIEFERKKREEP